MTLHIYLFINIYLDLSIDNALHGKSHKAIPDAISVNTKLSTNKQEIANEFNKFLQRFVQTITLQLLIDHTRVI